MSLNRQSISSDLNHLLSLPSSTITSLLDSSNTSNEPTSTKTSSYSITTNNDSAIEVLNSFSSSKATHEESQQLIKAYISEMNQAKHLEKSGEIDKLGQKIDILRDKGQNLESTLNEVKV
ncbi:uncharacterized protein L201_006125 [Kwoniella dendrophila CBS 6074]|uniref:Uncharacterized protein n=1 Tax=Kwoniella dendrophila CBS 6074 TaxID=1295534 RepID=A0AAX4K1C8_9TREE